MHRKEVSADVAIDAFLSAVKDAAAEMPEFRARLISALGYTVLYEGAEQFEGADPVAQANRWSPDAFKRIWGGATVSQLKKTLKDRELATTEDMRGRRKPELIELLFDRAHAEAKNDGRI